MKSGLRWEGGIVRAGRAGHLKDSPPQDAKSINGKLKNKNKKENIVFSLAQVVIFSLKK